MILNNNTSFDNITNVTNNYTINWDTVNSSNFTVLTQIIPNYTRAGLIDTLSDCEGGCVLSR